jgi:hypothetical protein
MLLGLCGDSSTTYNPVCATAFAHSMCNGTLCELYTQCASSTVRTVHTGCIPHADGDPFHSRALYGVCAIAFACIPYADCDPLHSCVLYPLCAMYAAHMLCIPCILCVSHTHSSKSSDILSLMFHHYFFLSHSSFLAHNIVDSCVYVQIRKTVFKMMPLQGKNKQEKCAKLNQTAFLC